MGLKLTPSDWANVVIAAISAITFLGLFIKGFYSISNKLDKAISDLSDMRREIEEMDKRREDDKREILTRIGVQEVEMRGFENRLLKIEIADKYLALHPALHPSLIRAHGDVPSPHHAHDGGSGGEEEEEKKESVSSGD